MATLQQFTAWYMHCGVRKVEDVKLPVVRPLEELTYPAYTNIHYIQTISTPVNGVELFDDEDELILGPKASDPIFKNHSSVNLITEIVQRYTVEPPLGGPRIVMTTIASEVAKYIGSSSNIKKMKDNRALLNDKNIGLYTYTAMESVYAYQTTDKAAWYRFYNWYRTVLDTIKKSMEEDSNRQQFILMEPPITLNSLSTLRQTMNDMDGSVPYVDRIPLKWLKFFKTQQDRLFLDLWLFSGTGRSLSLFNEVLGDTNLDKINILWQIGQSWATINLGRLNSFIIADGNKKGTTTPMAMEATYLVYVMRLSASFNNIDLGAPEDNPDLTDEEKIQQLDEPTRVLDIEADRVTSNKIDIAIVKPEKRKPVMSENKALAKLKEDLKAIDKDKSSEGASDEVSDEVIEAAIQRDLDQLEAASAQRAIESTYEDRYRPYEPTVNDHTSTLNKHIDAMEKKGQLSAKEVARLKRMANYFKEAKNPWGGNETIEEFMKIDPELLNVPESVKIVEDVKGVRDKGMLESSLSMMAPHYITNVMRKDIINSLMHLQNSKYIVTDIKVTRTTTMMDDFEVITAKIMTLKGKEKLIKMQYPISKKDGSYVVGGIKQRLRNQHRDLPFRKVSPTKVALTSYISKIFITRTDRAAFNYSRWLTNGLRSRILDGDDLEIQNIAYGKVFDRTKALPRSYTAISNGIAGFDYQGYRFNFDIKQINKMFTKEQIDFAKKHKVVPLATNGTNGLYLGINNIIIREAENGYAVVDSIENLFGLDVEKIPVDYVEYGLLGDPVPLGVILAYHLGLGNLLATLKTQPRRFTRGTRYTVQPNEYVVKFEDEVLVLDRDDKVTALLISGFNRYKRDISRMSIYHFDTKEAFATLLANNNINPNKLIDVDVQFELWIDAITAGILSSMNLPTDMVGLLLKATEVLTNDKHSDPNDASEQRDAGLERVAGTIYRESYLSARANQSKSLVMAGGFDLNPNAVWYGILNDTAAMGVEESNPIHALKEQEELTLGGTGGRSTRTLMAADRKFDRNSIGVISTDSVDSSEVGAKIFTSANPNYTSVRGTARPIGDGDLNQKVTRLMSTSVLLAPGVDRDDGKRVNFINIQNSSSTFVKDQTPMPLRTGYERIMAHRFKSIDGDLWAAMAKDDGEVVSIKNNVITVKYKDGETDAVELGVRHGVWSGQHVPHEVITELKVGDKVKKDNVIAYNKHYFKRDSLYPDQVIFANSTLARVVIWESDDTYEDSSAITSELAERLTTTFAEKRVVKVNFDFEIRNLVNVGDVVEADDLLCMLFPPLSTDAADRHDEIAQDILERLSNESPRAKKRGKITSIKVMYSGDIEKMTSSLKHLVEHHDGDIYRKCKQLKIQPHDGTIPPNVRVGGTEVGDDVVMIQIMIDYDLGMAGGDKVVFAHQAKSVVNGIVTGRLETKTGVKCQAIFGGRSIEARIIRSIYYMGTSNRLLKKIGDDAASIFFKNAIVSK